MSATACDRKCPMCGAEAYLCPAPHTDGKRYVHCTRASMHNFEIAETASLPGG